MSCPVKSRQLCSQLLRGSSTASSAVATPSCSLQAACSSRNPRVALWQTRSYAAPRAPKSSRPPPKAPRLPSQPRSEVRATTNITPEAFAEVIRRTDGVFDTMSPEQYYEVAASLADAFIMGPSSFSVRLKGEDAAPPNVLHELGCIIKLTRPTTQISHEIAVAMWTSASEMGYKPSTISLARDVFRAGAWGRKAQLRKLETRFRQIVSEGKDGDALTVDGEMLYEQGQHGTAAKVLERALALDDPSFEWEHHCQLCLGKSYLKLGKPAEAKKVLEDMGDNCSPEGHAELADLLRTSDPEKSKQHRYLAAINGKLDMFRYLAETAFEDEARATDAGSRKDHHLWAMEWSRLADLKEKV
ncbi:Tetratricopeptide-like helical [Fusarium albosuccineum]|uniref:Tetratricopeptide-like helical n=1 Tax=Fusarium albosuccineum TaxID=1237068 RepID=A0A8H4NV90_9HYPO|nr:Tetratricopeptide-like helical [Fusarium albosuccineum]